MLIPYSAFNAQGSRLIIVVVQLGAVKIQSSSSGGAQEGNRKDRMKLSLPPKLMVFSTRTLSLVIHRVRLTSKKEHQHSTGDETLIVCGNYDGERYEGTKPLNPKKVLQNIFVRGCGDRWEKSRAGRVWGCSCRMFSVCVCAGRVQRRRRRTRAIAQPICEQSFTKGVQVY